MADLTVPHLYAAVVRRIIDGDTIVVDEDHGKKLWMRDQEYRLAGGNAWDRGEPGYAEATRNLAVLVGTRVVIASMKPSKDVEPDKYGGRWLARVRTTGGDLTDLLIRSGWMVFWDGRGPKPKPVWPRPAGLPQFSDLLTAG